MRTGSMCPVSVQRHRVGQQLESVGHVNLQETMAINSERGRNQTSQASQAQTKAHKDEHTQHTSSECSKFYAHSWRTHSQTNLILKYCWAQILLMHRRSKPLPCRSQAPSENMNLHKWGVERVKEDEEEWESRGGIHWHWPLMSN